MEKREGVRERKRKAGARSTSMRDKFKLHLRVPLSKYFILIKSDFFRAAALSPRGKEL